MELIETRDYVNGFPASVVAVENSSDILIPYPFNVMVFFSLEALCSFSLTVF